jgi:uncharacterized protein YjbJ (UPF0337 family)
MSRGLEPSSCAKGKFCQLHERGESMMKPSTDDKTTGKIHEVKGTIKEKVGEITKNPDLEAEGRAEKNAGKVQNWVGKVEKAVGE